jgi:hypothetical protein
MEEKVSEGLKSESVDWTWVAKGGFRTRRKSFHFRRRN